MGRRGIALVWVLFGGLLFTMLGASLLNVAMSDLRVSRNLVAAIQAHYAAEAGIEWAVAVLRSKPDEAGWSYTGSEAPAFDVAVSYDGNDTWTVRSDGRSGGMKKTLAARASLRLFGRTPLIGRVVRLEGVRVDGHVRAEEITITATESLISGDLRAGWVQTTGGGSYRLGGHLCEKGKPYRVEVDFNELAAGGGWFVPEGSGPYRFDGETGSIGDRVLVWGDVVITEDFAFSGLMVVRGRVALTGVAAGSGIVILAERDVVLAGGEADWEGSLFIYSAGEIRREGSGDLSLTGTLMAESLALRDVRIVYCDFAARRWRKELPETLVMFCPSFRLEWVDLWQRR